MTGGTVTFEQTVSKHGVARSPAPSADGVYFGVLNRPLHPRSCLLISCSVSGESRGVPYLLSWAHHAVFLDEAPVGDPSHTVHAVEANRFAVDALVSDVGRGLCRAIRRRRKRPMRSS